MDLSPFHVDELAAQSLAHQNASGAGIRAFMPDQHREFFALVPYLFVATADDRGWPVASMFTGEAGFVRSPDPTHLRIDRLLPADDPAAAGLEEGHDVALLGLDLSTRRRNRANGRVAAIDGSGVTVAVAQSFGNCAQYIQTRRPTACQRQPSAPQRLDRLDEQARALIGSADTFFVASRARAAIDHAGGLDVSHRGGRSGFVDVQGDALVVPDFRGNRFFNTLGNLLGDPRAGLLFIDFGTGELLQLQGRVTIDWTDRAAASVAGAQRSWRVEIERGWRRGEALPFDWTFGDYAPTTLATGVWHSGQTSRGQTSRG